MCLESPLGYLLAVLMMRLVQTDMMGFDLAIFPRTYGLTELVVMAIMLVSQVPAIRQMNRLNLASVTKEQANRLLRRLSTKEHRWLSSTAAPQVDWQRCA